MICLHVCCFASFRFVSVVTYILGKLGTMSKNDLRGITFVGGPILGLHVTSSFSKTKEPPKLLSSSGMRGGISVNNFSAQEYASSKNRHTLNFKVMAVRDIKLRTCLSENIYISKDF